MVLVEGEARGKPELLDTKGHAQDHAQAGEQHERTIGRPERGDTWHVGGNSDGARIGARVRAGCVARFLACSNGAFTVGPRGARSYNRSVTEPRASRFEWILLLAGLAGMTSLLGFGRGAPPDAGSTVLAPITLVAADRHNLSCALPKPVGPYGCAFEIQPEEDQGTPRAVQVAEGRRLAPYVTTDRILYLVPGLFEQPAVRERYEADRARKKQPRKPKRFVARCEVRRLEKIESFLTRWQRRGKWERSGPAWVVEPVRCTVDG